MQTKWLFVLASLASSIHCAPAPKAEAAADGISQSKRAATYTFDVYQVSGCTGESDPISGTGATDGCVTGNIENGSGMAFIAQNIQSGYTVYLYQTQSDCTGDSGRTSYLDKITSSTQTNKCFDEFDSFAPYIVVKD